MYDYQCTIVRVVDGDTVDVDIDLGFDTWRRGERIRLYGIDTPECRHEMQRKRLPGSWQRILSRTRSTSEEFAPDKRERKIRQVSRNDLPDRRHLDKRRPRQERLACLMAKVKSVYRRRIANRKL
jgi:hypothetical protein